MNTPRDLSPLSVSVNVPTLELTEKVLLDWEIADFNYQVEVFKADMERQQPFDSQPQPDTAIEQEDVSIF